MPLCWQTEPEGLRSAWAVQVPGQVPGPPGPAGTAGRWAAGRACLGMWSCGRWGGQAGRPGGGCC